MDHAELVDLLKILRDNGVTEYRDETGLHLVLRPDVPPTVAPPVDRVPRSAVRSEYEALFPRGQKPSFEQFRNAGLVTE